jgi:hypothetical protein|tara:strand:+ start:132 stop:656 length:525 start_codon:yes stop_codon:yes gene_type:complete
MEEKDELKTNKFALKYGFLTGLIGIVWLIMLFVLEAHYENSWPRFIIETTIQLSGIILASLAFKKKNLGFISIKQTLKTGIGVSLILSLIYVFYLFTLSNFIEPDFFNKTYEISYNYYIENFPEALEMQGISDKNKFLELSHSRTKWAYLSIPVLLCFLGLIISFITGLFIQKK